MKEHIRKTIEKNYPEEVHGMPHGAVIPELAFAVGLQDQLHADSAGGESGFDMKQSTMPDIPLSVEKTFEGVHPIHIVEEAATEHVYTHEVLAHKIVKEAAGALGDEVQRSIQCAVYV